MLEEELEYKRLKELRIFTSNYDAYIDTFQREDLSTDLRLAIEQFDELYKDSYLVAAIFSLDSFKPLLFSKNFKAVSGYDQEEILATQTFGIFRLLHWKQLSFPMACVVWRSDFYGSSFADGAEGTVNYFSGVRLKHANGKYGTWFFRTKYFSTKEEPKQRLSLIIGQDISHLVKPNSTFWALYSDYSSGRKCFYKDLKMKNKLPYLFSARELEVLQLIETGLHNSDIGEKLGISPFTVQQHRKNMLARIGVKDTTALLHIAKLCNVLQ